MELRRVLDQVRESDRYDSVAAHWEDSLASLPGGPIEFLLPQQLARFRSMAGMDPVVDSELFAAASRIDSSAPLRALIWHCVRTCYEYTDVDWYRLAAWPRFEASLGESAHLFYLIVGLAMVPLTRSKHRELGIPEEITRQTIGGPLAFLMRYRDGNGGKPGIYRRDVGWLRFHTAGELFRVGRFEYMLRPFHDPYHVYRNAGTREVVVLPDEGQRFTERGYADAHPGEGEPNWWQAHYRVDARTVHGFPVSPYGRAEHREVTLDLRCWKRVIDPETIVLDVHIPVGGKMTPEAIHSSFREATTFFERYFPRRPFAGFRCASWILGPQLEEIFPPETNLVCFLREVYLYPTSSSPYDGFFFIFSDDRLNERSLSPEDLMRLPQRTSLQARVRQYALARKPWRGGGMVLLNEDLERFGSQCYRSQWPPASLVRVDG
jgi:hypothetical protein